MDSSIKYNEEQTLTKRDTFALEFAKLIAVKFRRGYDADDMREISSQSVALADALISELNKPKQ